MDTRSLKRGYPPLRDPKPGNLPILSAKDPQHIKFSHVFENRGEVGASEFMNRDSDLKYDFDQLEGDPQSESDLCSTRTKWASVTAVTIILAVVFVYIQNKGIFI